MNLIAGAFAGLGMLFGGLFGGHHGDMGMGQQNPEASSSPRQFMGTSTPDHMGERAPGVLGKVVSVSGTTIIMNGRSDVPRMMGGMGTSTMSNKSMEGMATTTYTVDASSAKIIKFGTRTASSTPLTISDIKAGDNILVVGSVSGTTITATTIADGLPMRPMMRPLSGAMMGRGRMGGTTSDK